MKVDLRFEGGQKLAATLASLPDRVSLKVQRRALMEAAEPMRAMAQRGAPREPGAPDLADNIVISPLRGGTDSFGDARAAGVAIGPAKAFFYGFFQEWGTVHHGPQAFMRPAFDATAQKTLQLLRMALWTEISRAGFGAAPTGGSGGSL